MLISAGGPGETRSAGTEPEPPEPIALEAGQPAPAAGDFWTAEGSALLLEAYRARRHRYQIAEARVATLEATVEALEARLAAARAEARVWALDVEIERLRCPSWAERHLGWSVGVGAGWDPFCDGGGTECASAFLGAVWGFRP